MFNFLQGCALNGHLDDVVVTGYSDLIFINSIVVKVGQLG